MVLSMEKPRESLVLATLTSLVPYMEQKMLPGIIVVCAVITAVWKTISSPPKRSGSESIIRYSAMLGAIIMNKVNVRDNSWLRSIVLAPLTVEIIKFVIEMKNKYMEKNTSFTISDSEIKK
jgi:hypothetical protein